MAATDAPPAATSMKPQDPEPTSCSPVEMSELPPASPVPAEDTTAGAEQIQPNDDTALRPTTTRQQSLALGPGAATDSPIPPPTLTPSSGPVLSITIMLTTGLRHPFLLSQKYLTSRNVAVAGGDVREISGYKLKELIWTDWRPEWEARPASPGSIRLIILGRLVEDQRSLREFPFKLDDTNVVHMTVKPADFLDDDDGAGGKGHSIRGRDDGERGAGCRCVVQ